MTSLSPIIDLKNALPEEFWRWVIPALRQEPVIWEALQNPDFRGHAIKELDSRPEGWSPMNLALLILDENLTLKDVKSTSLEVLSPALHRQASQVYEQQINKNPPIMDLWLAGLLALHLSQHPDLPKAPQWKTTLACLFSLLPEPIEYLRGLPPQLAVHVLLANPILPAEQRELFIELITFESAEKRLGILRHLSIQRPELAALVAQRVAPQLSLPDLGYAPSKFGSQLAKLSSLLIKAEIQSIAGQADDGLSPITEALKEIQGIRNALATQIAQINTCNGDIEAALTFWNETQSHLSRPDPESIAEMALSLLEHGYIDEIRSWPGKELSTSLDEPTNPSLHLAAGTIALHQGDEEQAYHAALQALEGYAEETSYKPSHIHLLAKLFLKLGHPHDAIRAVNITLQERPNHLKSITLLARCCWAAGEMNTAIQAAHLAVALAPERIDLHRELTEILEASGRWHQALRAREAFIQSNQPPEPEDLYALANCAIKADQPQRAAGVCQQLIQTNPEDGQAHCLLGEAYAALGDPQKARGYLLEATQLPPDQARPWLALADLLQQTDEHEKALETLQAACHAIPDDPEVQLALGEIHLREDALTQALAAFRKADTLTKAAGPQITQSTKTQVALSLGKILYRLGHIPEACQTLEKAYKTAPRHAGIAHIYAKTLLALNRPEEAIPPLTEALKSSPEDLDIYLDYARASMSITGHPTEARDALLHILEIDPSHAEARALLAEAYEANQELEAALEAYQFALNTELQDDPSWYARLSLGLGRAALGLNQPEVALAAIKGALKVNPQDISTLQALSTAFLASHLDEKALLIAKTALDLAPTDLENLDWFIGQATQLEATEEAVSALHQALELDPRRADLLTKLGWLHIHTGNFEAARQTFSRIRFLDQVLPTDLHAAAQGLLATNDPPEAIDCLNEAISMNKSTGEDALLPNLLRTQAKAYQQIGDLEQALETLEMAISASPDDPDLLGEKANLLLTMNRHQEAIVCIEDGIAKVPKSASLRLQAATIHRTCGDIDTAFAHAQAAVDLCADEHKNLMTLPSVTLAADLANALLHTSQARAILEGVTSAANTLDRDDKNLEDPSLKTSSLEFHCLRAELALEADEEIATADALTSALQLDPDHPRVLALQARLTARQGDRHTAEQTLQSALEALGDFTNIDQPGIAIEEREPLALISYPSTTYIAVAKAVMSFQQWSVAVYLLQKAVEAAPNEPRPHFELVRTLVLRAEYQRLCEILNILHHAPGKSATADYAYRLFEDSILKAANLIAAQNPPSKGKESVPSPDPKAMIATWLARGQAIFRPSAEHAQALKNLPPTPENRAAQIAALRYCGDRDSAAKTALRTFQVSSQDKSSNPELLGQIALALTKGAPEMALIAIQKSTEISIRQNLPNRPIFHAIQAHIAHRTQDPELHLQAIQAALAVWPDEPNWHALAADLLLHQQADHSTISQAIHHLEQATQLEPKHAPYFLKLGDAYQRTGDQKEAIRVLEQATRTLPEKPGPWLALAQAYRATGDTPQTIRCATQAAQIAPFQAQAHLLLAEIALEMENPHKAQGYIEAILEQNPNHPQALLFQAKTFTALNKPGEALAALDRAIPHIPQSIPLHLERVQLIRQTQGEASALDVLQELVAQYPHELRILAVLAEILAESGEVEEAVQVAQEALNTASSDLESHEYVQSLHLLGRLLRKSGQLDQAIHYLSEAIELAPDMAGPYIELGRIYHERRQYHQALESLRQAIAVAPNDPQPYYFAGLALKEIKDYGNAEVMLHRAATLAPDNLNIHRQLGAVVAINLVHNPRQKRFAIPIESIEA